MNKFKQFLKASTDLTNVSLMISIARILPISRLKNRIESRLFAQAYTAMLFELGLDVDQEKEQALCRHLFSCYPDASPRHEMEKLKLKMDRCHDGSFSSTDSKSNYVYSVLAAADRVSHVVLMGSKPVYYPPIAEYLFLHTLQLIGNEACPPAFWRMIWNRQHSMQPATLQGFIKCRYPSYVPAHKAFNPL